MAEFFCFCFVSRNIIGFRSVFSKPLVVNLVVYLFPPKDAPPKEPEYFKKEIENSLLTSYRKEENDETMCIPCFSVPDNIGAFDYLEKFIKDLFQFRVLNQ